MKNTIYGQESSKKALELITKKNDLEYIVNLGEELLATPICYSDPSINYRLKSKGYPPNFNQDSNSYRENLSINNYSRKFLEELESINDDSPFLIDSEENGRNYVCKIYYHQKHLGFIIIPEIETPLEGIDGDLIKLIGNACAISLSLIDMNKPIKPSFNQENIIFEKLFYGMYNTIDEFNEKAKAYSFDNYNHFCLISILSELSSHDYIKRSIHSLSKSYNFGFWNMIHDNKIIILIGFQKDSTNIHDIMYQIEELISKENPLIGVSDPFSHLLAIKYHYETLRQLSKDTSISMTNKKIFFYDDYKFNVFLSDMNMNIDNSLKYISYKVIAILNYDKEYNTEYALTLKNYLSTNLSPKLTSDLLFIHRNTVIYRINRIKEIFDIDFNNVEQNFQLYFSFQLLLIRGWGKTIEKNI